MPAADELVANNEVYAQSHAPVAGRPSRQVVVVACMDARMDVYALLGLRPGEAHVLRNAGGIVTDDVLRSLAISQRYLGTREVVLVHHTECGMSSFTDEEFAGAVRADTGQEPPWAAGAFTDVDEDVRTCIERVRSSPFLLHRESVRGFVFDVVTGRLREVGGG